MADMSAILEAIQRRAGQSGVSSVGSSPVLNQVTPGAPVPAQPQIPQPSMPTVNVGPRQMPAARPQAAPPQSAAQHIQERDPGFAKQAKVLISKLVQFI